MLSGAKNILDILTPEIVSGALPTLSKDLSKYLWIQNHYATKSDLKNDTEFWRHYNGFYRITPRRDTIWQSHYYGLMQQLRESDSDFRQILFRLHSLTDRWESSFASKMLATMNQDSPVIDSEVFKQLNLRLPYHYKKDRGELICAKYQELKEIFEVALSSNRGNAIITKFNEVYPDVNISNTKVLDFLLWRSGRAVKQITESSPSTRII